MKRSILYILLLLVYSSCNKSKESSNNDAVNTKKVIYPSDNPAERLVWEQIRFRDPISGVIPDDIRRKELMFAKNKNSTAGDWSQLFVY